MKKILLTMIFLLVASPVFAGGYLMVSPDNQTSQGIAGADATGLQEVIRVTDGAIHVTELSGILADPINGIVDIPNAGATDRTQLTDVGTVYSCSIQAPLGNATGIYVGGSTVTNSSGTNEGILIMPGWSVSVGKLLGLDEYYVAADTAGDDVKYLCQ